MSSELLDSKDPILTKRRQIERLVKLGLRTGYGLYLLATALLLFGFWSEFTNLIEGSIIACLIIGSILLAPSIVFSYAVKAADKADRNNSW